MRRKRYGAEFKHEAVKLASRAGMSKRQVAQDRDPREPAADVGQAVCSGKWEAAPSAALKIAQQLENERLKRELKRVMTERRTPKKGGGLLREGKGFFIGPISSR